MKSVFSPKGVVQPIRIDLRFSGCCDAALGLCVDTVHENDLSEEFDGLTFIIDREIYRLTGDISISYVNKEGGRGYVITSNNPVSEWEGFSVTDIKF
jgi:Fe-S cluster assembly iron-binding protein IscA